MDRALSQAGRRGGHTLARRARLRHAPEPLHRLGQDRPPAGLHGRGDQRLTGGALAEWTPTRQDPRDPLRRPGSRRLNSPTVSGRIYQQTFIDTYSKVALAKLYDRKTPLTAADLLNDRVVPFFDA